MSQESTTPVSAPAKAPPDLSVVIPAFNEEKWISATLDRIGEALKPLAAGNWSAEIIVCDNNSTDQTAALAREGGARVVFERVNQIARARNTGACAANGRWLVFIDADSWPSIGLFTEMAEAIEGGRVTGGGATIQLDRPVPWGSCITGIWNGISRCLRWVAGSFIFCERKTFNELGGFNTELFASEEIEFSRRLKRAARKERKSVVILHRHPLTTSARKVHLYSKREYLRFLGRTVWHRGANLRERSSCIIWYDGRR